MLRYLIAFLMVTAAMVPFRFADAQSWVPPESLDSLPVVAELPDLFTFADGRPAKTVEDWELRRKEMKAILQYYEYGHIPPRPDVVKVEDLKSRQLVNCDATEELMTLVIGSKTQLRMRIALYRPSKAGRLPVIIREEAVLGHIEEVPLLIKRGFMLVEYAREDLDPDKPNVVGPAQKAYPDYDWATLAVWAWGGMRVVDYLESRKDVDLSRVGILGHSRGGKMALLLTNVLHSLLPMAQDAAVQGVIVSKTKSLKRWEKLQNQSVSPIGSTLGCDGLTKKKTDSLSINIF